MRRDVLELRAFYASRLGAAVRELVSRKLVEAWGDAHGLGYATPFLEPFALRARRTVAAMPGAQGVERWPVWEPNLACLGDEGALPFPNALFDRILVIHGLEESDDPDRLLAEVKRVLSPSGRLIVAVASRRGFWAGSEAGRWRTRSHAPGSSRPPGRAASTSRPWPSWRPMPKPSSASAPTSRLRSPGSSCWKR
jgi:SAM-dependent methyltransferase